MNELNTKCFRSQRREGYFGIYLILVIMFYVCYYPIIILFENFNNLDGLLTGIIGLTFVLWIIFNLIREHFIFRSNFISNDNIIMFNSLIYHKEIKWIDVESITIDILTSIPSYLPNNVTKCIVLNLKSNEQKKIPSNAFKNIERFKKYLNENFHKKITQPPHK